MRMRAARRVRGWAAAVLAAAAAGACLPAGAVILAVTDTGSNYGISLRVGSAAATDTVAFAVTGNNAGLTPTAVTGTPAIQVWVAPVRPVALLAVGEVRPVTLRVDSSVALQCISGGCGTTLIPFTKISWVASNNSGTTSGDIQSGTFTAGTLQAITSPATGFNANATTCLLVFCDYQSNNISATQMQFIYANDTVYPAGVYKGTVHFTATME